MDLWRFLSRELGAILAACGMVLCLLWFLRTVVIPLVTNPDAFWQQF
jgi:hypothetical protein